MKKSFLISAIITLVVVFFFAAIPVFAQSKEDVDLLEKCDTTTSFKDTDFSAEYTLVQDKPGQGKSVTKAIMYRRDKTANYTILITSPEKDKGKAYLQIEDQVWFFDPEDRRFTFSSKRDKFQSTNANTSDFAPMDFCKNYKIVSSIPKKLGSKECILFELEAKVDDVAYPKLKVWITKDDGLIRKKEDYSLSGQLLRTTLIPSYQFIGERSIPIPNQMIIVDNLKGRKIDDKMRYENTTITIENVSFAQQKDSVFTKAFIEMSSNR